MAQPNVTKPATAPHDEPASIPEQLGGQLGIAHTPTPKLSQLNADRDVAAPPFTDGDAA
jgi:hypothetical protein